MEIVVLDLNDIFPPKSSVQTVQSKISQWDTAPYKDKHVQLKGCSPTWAHLIVAGRLFGTASAIDFIMDDGKGGVPVPVYNKVA